MFGSKMIVDGYNLLLHGKGTLASDSLWQRRDQVIKQLSNFAAMKKIQIVLVFDGREKIRDEGQVFPSIIHVLFSKPPENADALIKRLVEKEKQPARHVTVVTSDRAVAYYVKSCGCRHWTTETFRIKLGSLQDSTEYDEKFRQSASATDMAEWLKLFGVDGEE